MFGIVVWSSNESGKALIWCEDQADLAVFEPGDVDGQLGTLLPNDCGYFELSESMNGMRTARIIEYLGQSRGASLPDHLLNSRAA